MPALRRSPEGIMTLARLLLQKKSPLQLSFWETKELPQRPLLLGIHCPQSSWCLQDIYPASFVQWDRNPCRPPLPF
jgi:hypothetical protein